METPETMAQMYVNACMLSFEESEVILESACSLIDPIEASKFFRAVMLSSNQTAKDQIFTSESVTKWIAKNQGILHGAIQGD
jgi:hypothetical protein